MKTRFISQADNSTLLLYFTGWGNTDEVVRHLSLPDGWDYFSAYDYRRLDPQELPDFKAYEQVYLVAWSMGVWAADHLSPHLPKITKSLAINGTPLPMHNRYGIPDLIFKGTLEGLDDENRARFNRRMCGGKQLLAVFNSFAARSTEDLREELLGVYHQVNDLPDDTPPRLKWSEAMISEKDLIVPSQNQLAYWQRYGVPFRFLEHLGHYPMMEFTTWRELLDL